MEEATAAARADGWENVVFGMGGTKDPSVYTTYSLRNTLTDPALEALYVQEHFAAKIIEALPREAMRPGWDLVVAGDPAEVGKQRTAFAATEARLGVVEELLQGAFWGRTFGGALTWVGAEDGQEQDQPLNEEKIETIRFVHTFDRRDVQIVACYGDPKHPKFRKPMLYKVQPRPVAMSHGADGTVSIPGTELAGGVTIHESRCVAWPGQPTTDSRASDLSGWDDSILERCWEPLKQVGEDFAGKGLLLGRISQTVFKIVDLYKMISGKLKEVVAARMGMLDASRSRGRSILLDVQEDMVQVTQPTAGVDLLISLGILRLAAAAEIPITVLMRIPGDNSDRESDLELWASQADAWREHVLRPRHGRVSQLICLAKDGPTGGKIPEGMQIRYRPLRNLTRTQLAQVRKTEAETNAIIIDKGMAQAEAIAAQRYTPDAGNELVLDPEELKAALDRRKQLASQPPKDNAELGTVGARATAAMDVVKEVATGQIDRESGKAILVEMFRLEDETAEKVLGPKGFEPKPPPTKPGTPGPDANPPRPGGAGAPPQLPGVDDGGNPKKKGTETEPVVE